MSDRLKWWQGPVRMMRRDYVAQFDEFMKADLGELARLAKERWHVNCEWVMATPGCAPGLAHQTLFNSEKLEKFAALGDFDMLREYLPHARRHGVRLVPYVNVHWYSYAFADAHPGWEVLLDDGRAYGRVHPMYGGGTTFCINSSWRDFAFEMIRETMRTGVDGVFLDGPTMPAQCCYCDSCRERFAQSAGGAALPAWDDWRDPLWKRFLAFREDSMAAFLKDAHAAVREVEPDGVIFMNGGRFSAYPNALDCRTLARYSNFVGAEEFFHCSDEYDPPWRSLNLARYLSAGDTPSVVFTHHCLSQWHYIPLGRSEATRAFSQTVAGGANTWFAIFMEAMKTHADEAYDAVAETHAFLEKHAPYYTSTESAAEVAALLSKNTANYYVSGRPEITADVGSGKEVDLVADLGTGETTEAVAARRAASAKMFERESHGCLDICNSGHVPVRALWDDHVTDEALAKVTTLLLPNTACLSNAQIASVKRFVEAGGGLVATFESGMYDQWGDAKTRRSWMRFLGVAAVEGAFAPSRCEDYMTATTARLAGFARGEMLPRLYNALKVKPTRDAETLALFNEPIGLAYVPLRGVSRYPAALLAKRGKGRVVYLAGALFETFERFHTNVHLALARACLALAAGPKGFQVETNAPGGLAVEVRRQRGRVLIHLMNVTSDMKRPMGAVVPLRDIALDVRARGVKGVRCLSAARKLPFESHRGRVTFTVPKVKDYEVVVMETGGG